MHRLSVLRRMSRNTGEASRVPDKSKHKAIIEGSFKLAGKRSYEKNIFCGDAAPAFSALGFSDGSIEISNIKGVREVTKLCPLRDEDPKLPATSIHFLNNSDKPSLLLASYVSGYTTLWNFEDKQGLWDVKEDGETYVNALSSDMSHFAVAGSDAKVNLYDTETHEQISTFQRGTDENILDGHEMRIFALKFNPGSNTEVVSGGWDNTVQIWDVRQQQSVRHISGPHICGDGIDFMNNGQELVTAAWSKTTPLQRWDFRSCELLEDLVLGDIVSYLYCCRYIPSGNFILTAGAKLNMICIYDIMTKSVSASYERLPDGVYYAQEVPHSLKKERENRFKIYAAFGNCICHLELNI